MTQKNAEKKKARQLQREVGKEAVSYQSCLNMLREYGFDEAKRRIEEMVAFGDAELSKLKETP